ncbi:MAG: hypothetical protein OdinLCB4_000345 [Candidatus Odinarchaeum yellowstonii]|uniref:Uncharacterized protein n=1 Tax=Odinarchaeota yellowstonii (strain LCB_4) TaxID=1841599 RepID=A0AAF0IB59_ODILC|nr:MAG: hypothetical protein OdinLCB4_000345 [Candidatus Odinarchaeum yellowstonii]
MEEIGENLKRLKKEVLNLLIGRLEDRYLSKSEVLKELDKPLINVTDKIPENIFKPVNPQLADKITLSENDLKEFLAVLNWFNIDTGKIGFSNPEPDLYYVHYDASDLNVKNIIDTFFDLFTAKFLRMTVKQKIELSERSKWKWSDVLKMLEEGLKTSGKTS